MFDVPLNREVRSAPPTNRQLYTYDYNYSLNYVTDKMKEDYVEALIRLGFVYNITVGSSDFYVKDNLRVQLSTLSTFSVIVREETEVPTTALPMYAEAPKFPDFGAMFGVPLNRDVRNAPTNDRQLYRYDFNYAGNNVTDKMKEDYVDALIRLGFEYTSTVGSSDFYRKDNLRVQLSTQSTFSVIVSEE
jgi:predicted RNA binding protein YcfA (HicA-like mRNA interferase family)